MVGSRKARSQNLRSHPGQTALPGGKYDETDESLISTAYREAFEEIALDITSPHLRTIITLPPFISAKKLIVTPTIGLLSDPSVLDTLVPSKDEVDLIFDHPVKVVSNTLKDPSLSNNRTNTAARLLAACSGLSKTRISFYFYLVRSALAVGTIGF